MRCGVDGPYIRPINSVYKTGMPRPLQLQFLSEFTKRTAMEWLDFRAVRARHLFWWFWSAFARSLTAYEHQQDKPPQKHGREVRRLGGSVTEDAGLGGRRSSPRRSAGSNAGRRVSGAFEMGERRPRPSALRFGPRLFPVAGSQHFECGAAAAVGVALAASSAVGMRAPTRGAAARPHGCASRSIPRGGGPASATGATRHTSNHVTSHRSTESASQ